MTPTSIRKLSELFGDFSVANVSAADHFDMLLVGAWTDPDQSYLAVPTFKQHYPNCAILGYIGLPNILSAQWMSSQWNTFGAPYGYDGIFIDMCSPNYGVAGVSDTQTSMETLLTTIKALIPNCIIMVNGVSDVVNGIPLVPTNNYIQIGTIEEFAFAQNWGRTTKQDIDTLAYWTGKGVQIGIIHSGPYYNDARGTAAPADTVANCNFALACFLCGVQNNLGWFSWTDYWTTPSRGYYPIMDVDPGTPLGPYTQSGNILTRNFANVTVTVDLVNMTGTITPVQVTPPTAYVVDIWAMTGGITNPTGQQTINAGTQVTITATPNQGYSFNGWLVNNQPASANPLTLTITGPTTVIPQFQTIPTFTLTIIPSTGGKTDPQGAISVKAGDNTVVNATADQGYVFDHWLFDGQDQTPWFPTSTFTLWNAQANHTLQAVFTVATQVPTTQAGVSPAFLLVLGGITVGGLVIGLTRGKKNTQRRRK